MFTLLASLVSCDSGLTFSDKNFTHGSAEAEGNNFNFAAIS